MSTISTEFARGHTILEDQDQFRGAYFSNWLKMDIDCISMKARKPTLILLGIRRNTHKIILTKLFVRLAVFTRPAAHWARSMGLQGGDRRRGK